MSRRLRREDYTVGWICALPVELAAAQEMLDEEHDDLEREIADNDENLYSLGSIAGHNVAIVCLPAGGIGDNPPAAVAAQIRATFKGIRFVLMVVVGGVPGAEIDVRLGDVVVSQPYDIAKESSSWPMRMRSLNSPPWILHTAVARVRVNELQGRSKLREHISQLDRFPIFQRNKTGRDVLFKATSGPSSADRLETRQPRESEEEVVVHYGMIASANQVMRHAAKRDEVIGQFGGLFYFEMKAAGLMNSFPCLMIRGICDYADSHKNKMWQAYAAGTAAAYAKEVLSVISPADVAKTNTGEQDLQLLTSPPAKRRETDSSGRLENNVAERHKFTPTSRSRTGSMTSASMQTQLSPKEKDCLRSLSFPEQESRYDAIHVAKNTCYWLLEDPDYRAWMENPRGLFWIRGKPGSGKSALMKFAVKKMHERKPGELILSAFVHGQGTDLQKTPLGIFRVLLNSMLGHFPKYLARLTEEYEDREKRFGGYMADRWKWSDQELRELLSNVLTKETKHQPVNIFIDALDECGEGPAKSLLAYFKDLAKQVEREESQVKICLSSRHYPILDLDTIPAIFVEERNDKDIQWYIQERLKAIRPKSKRQRIENEIWLKAQGDFRWVFLVTEMAIRADLAGDGRERILEAVTSAPETLNELYALILSSVSEAEKRQMVKLFQWILFAERPLSAQELWEALATDKDMEHTTIAELRKHQSGSDTFVEFETHIKHMSRGLVEFEIWEQYELNGEDWDREVQLIHHSVADYLLREFLGNGEHNQDDFRSQIGAGHFQISRSCLRYLTLREVLEGAQLPPRTLSSKFPLAPYATRFLFEHIQEAEQAGIPRTDLPSIIQWESRSSTPEKLVNLWRVLDPDRAHTLIGRLLRNVQDDQAPTTESIGTLWSDQAHSTNPSSLSYGAPVDMEQVAEGRSSMTFLNSLDPNAAYQVQGNEWANMAQFKGHLKTPSETYSDVSSAHASPYMGNNESYKDPVFRSDKRDDDIQSVKSMPDEIDSLVESKLRVGDRQQAVVDYIVTMFMRDDELLALYQEATQNMDEAKFVRNHRRLLKKFFLDLRFERHSPSQALAIGFFRPRSKRIHISSGIRSLVMPSDYTVREKTTIMLKQQKDNFFLLDRLLDERDPGAQPTPEDTAEEISDTTSEVSEGSDDDDDRSSDEPEAEILSKLEATAEFLISGQPFSLYKENLRRFLHPSLRAARPQESLQLDVAQTSSEQSFLNQSEGDCGGVTEAWPLQVQASDTTRMMHNEDSSTDEPSRTTLQNLSRLRNCVVPQLGVEEKSYNVFPNLPLFVDMVLQSLPLPTSEPPIPEGKVRARWKCRCGARLFDDFTELESGSVIELERELQELDGSANTTRNLEQTVWGWVRALWKPIEHRLRKQHPTNSSRGNMLPLEEIRQRSSVVPESNAIQPPSQTRSRCQDTLHLLLCIDKGNSGTPLHQEHLGDVSTDRKLFLYLRSKYFGSWNARHWFTLRSIGSLALSRFTLDFSNYTEVHKHTSICGPTCICLPPVDRLDIEYRCYPAPEVKPKYEPAIGSQRLTHYFLSPQCVDATQKTILAQLPKRIGHLRALNDQEEIGWGIYFQEGWHWRAVYFIVVILVALFGLLFGIIWSITKGDIQGAFTISSFCVTLGSLLLGYIVLRSV